MVTESPDGMLLFRELLRYFGGAYVDEYYRNGAWDMELLELDLQLLRGHHKDAGCPRLEFLELIPEVTLPEPAPPPWRKDSGKRLPAGTKRVLVTRDVNGNVKRVRAANGKGRLGKGAALLENGYYFQADAKGKGSGGGMIVPPPPPPSKRKGLLIPRRYVGNGSSATTSKAAALLHLPIKGVHTSSKASGHFHIPVKNGLKGSGKHLNELGIVFSKASAPAFSKASAPAFSKSSGRFIVGSFAKRSAVKLKASKEVTAMMLDPDFLD